MAAGSTLLRRLHGERGARPARVARRGATLSRRRGLLRECPGAPHPGDQSRGPRPRDPAVLPSRLPHPRLRGRGHGALLSRDGVADPLQGRPLFPHELRGGSGHRRAAVRVRDEGGPRRGGNVARRRGRRAAGQSHRSGLGGFHPGHFAYGAGAWFGGGGLLDGRGPGLPRGGHHRPRRARQVPRRAVASDAQLLALVGMQGTAWSRRPAAADRPTLQPEPAHHPLADRP